LIRSHDNSLFCERLSLLCSKSKNYEEQQLHSATACCNLLFGSWLRRRFTA
jgi:hypothetical protein